MKHIRNGKYPIGISVQAHRAAEAHTRHAAAGGGGRPPGASHDVAVAARRRARALTVEAEETALPAPPDLFKDCGGSDWPEFNSALIRSTLATVRSEPDDLDKRLAITCAGLKAFRPVDELEAMLGAQALGLHMSAMECLRRAMLANQPIDVASKYRRDAANLCRCVSDMYDAIARLRGKCQTIRIEKIEVSDGGQAAIIGNVGAAGGHGRGEG